MTRKARARYHALVPVTNFRPRLCELADIVEQIFRIACTENLHPRPEEYDAATCNYVAEHGLSDSAMRSKMRQYGTLTEIHERAQVIALMRLYGRRWRVWDCEGRQHRSRPNVTPRRKPWRWSGVATRRARSSRRCAR